MGLKTKINFANWLTAVRIFLALPVFYFLTGDGPHFPLAALTLFSIAALTDFLDGLVARAQGKVTVFGKFLDPLADKVLIVSALYGFVVLGYVPPWMFFLIFIREAAVTFLRMGKAEKYTPAILAKSKTAVQMAAIVFLIFLMCTSVPFNTIKEIAYFLMLGVVAITLISGANYFLAGIRK